MSKIEKLNSIFIERLMFVAKEIFEAVKDAVSEYQEEIEKTKQENRHLRKILSEISIRANSEVPTTDAPSKPADQAPFEQDFGLSNQRTLNLDSSVLELKLATIKQEDEPQLLLNSSSTSISASSESAHDTWTCLVDGVLLEQQISSQGPQDPEPPLIQLNNNTATVKEETGPQQLSTEKPICVQEPDQSALFTNLDIEGTKHNSQTGNSFVPNNLEPYDSQVLHSSETQIQSKNPLESMEFDLSSPATNTQSPLTEKLIHSGLCDKPVSRTRLLRKGTTSRQNKRLYGCTYCGECFSNAHLLRVHCLTHTSERPFHCESCGKMFKEKHHLKDHERIHTGEKRYSCSACGKSFIWTNQVNVHIKKHHHGQVATIIKKLRKR